MYLPPERIAIANGSGDHYSYESDVWAFGMTLLEIAERRYPVERDKGIFKILDFIVNQDSPRLSARWSKPFQVLIARCLRKKTCVQCVCACVAAGGLCCVLCYFCVVSVTPVCVVALHMGLFLLVIMSVRCMWHGVNA